MTRIRQARMARMTIVARRRGAARVRFIALRWAMAAE